MESKYWKDACFVTLTYNDDNLPRHIIDGHLFYSDEEIKKYPELSFIYEPTLHAKHLTNFFKRLRKHIEGKIRYYAVGEYGTRYGRPHYHMIIFGLPGTTANAQLIAKCWNYGFVDVRHFFKETCSYIAGYVQKKLYGKEKYLFKLPEFMRCSQHLGEQWLLDNIESFDNEHPYINYHGFKYGIPRQFRKILISKGRLEETSLIKTALLQKKEYVDLCEDLELKHTTLSEFFRHRQKIALEKEKRKLNKRNKTGDI